MDEPCGETIGFQDDEGENETTFICELPRGHEGMHVETGVLEVQGEDGNKENRLFTITWSSKNE